MKHRLKLIALGLLISTFPISIQAQAPVNKKPWEWTLEERLASRLDPKQIEKRELEREADYHSMGSQAKPALRERAGDYTIEGRRHPELLLPHELFRSLMTGFIPDQKRREKERQSLRNGILAAGFDEELFWSQLASVTGQYVLYLYNEPGPGGTWASDAKQNGCRVAYGALMGARELFGQERFDKLLYQVVAPQTNVSAGTTATDPAKELRERERGCR